MCSPQPQTTTDRNRRVARNRDQRGEHQEIIATSVPQRGLFRSWGLGALGPLGRGRVTLLVAMSTAMCRQGSARLQLGVSSRLLVMWFPPVFHPLPRWPRDTSRVSLPGPIFLVGDCHTANWCGSHFLAPDLYDLLSVKDSKNSSTGGSLSCGDAGEETQEILLVPLPIGLGVVHKQMHMYTSTTTVFWGLLGWI